ncbi:MAG: FMN-binding protein [Candidatus Roizmanbacteria bacterium]|nr:FMN-binding protein [Candidatus Roizmanbacteria bacterium]
MKQFILSTFVILSFFTFSLYYRLNGNAPVVSTASKQQAFTIQPSPIAGNRRGMSAKPMMMQGSIYADGSYTGDVADAFYGNIQVQAVIQNGKIADIQFLQYPSDRSQSRQISQYAMPLLKSEALQAQSAQVNIVSGATYTSQAFVQSLASALTKAKG